MTARDSEVDLAVLSPPGAAALTRLSAVETVRARILLAIEHALLAPGTRLPRTDRVAAGLEVSPITARRALESLVADGVLVRRPGRGGGTFVADAPPSLNDSSVSAYRADDRAIQRLIDQRVLMESAIVHEAARRATPAQCRELDRLVLETQEAQTWAEYSVADNGFHHFCAEISELPEVPTYLETYEALHKYFVPYPLERLQGSSDEHRALIAAFRAHDQAAAVSIARKHVGALRRDMFPSLSKR